MPSLISGYEYDIFISYRHKDNKSDGWVTEFVRALRSELEATFKEDISIYFDENPHDGLLQHHEVDDSLREKLRCLVFIPIVSQTYCDPKAFAWQHELLAFIKLATEDKLDTQRIPPGGTPGYAVCNIRAGTRLTKSISISLAVENIFDEDYRIHGSGVNEPGRNVILTAECSF